MTVPTDVFDDFVKMKIVYYQYLLPFLDIVIYLTCLVTYVTQL